ncbi:hypothetical protein TWF481_001624 [Arthrobotrys musiformis]|uniref:DUF7492 domain-containing protein n=1 Tax=Arthrobotrys musiformis TaxID=47236 RepID=A0AAV9VUW7_9PEZI
MDSSLKVSSLLGLHHILLILALLTGVGVNGHSWVDELTCASGPFFETDPSLPPSPGYIRNYVGRQSTEIDTLTTFRILDTSSKQPVCAPNTQSPGQLQEFPQLNATQGDLIKASYLENGHIWQTLAGQNGPKASPGIIYWYGTQNPRSDRDFASVREWTADGSGGDGEGFLLAKTDFDDAVCIETGHEDADPQNPRVGGPCSSFFRIPENAEIGKDLTVYWLWDYSEHFGPDPTYTEWYSSCMDIRIFSKEDARRMVEERAKERANGNARRDTEHVSADSTPVKGINRHIRRQQLHNERRNQIGEKKSSWFSW